MRARISRQSRFSFNSEAFANIKPYKILHPAQTRWLSLNDVVNRLLEQLPAIKLSISSFHRWSSFCSRFALPIFTDLNEEMQAEIPKLPLLYDQIYTAYMTILECFIKPVYLELTEEEKNKAKDISNAKEQKVLSVDVNAVRIHICQKGCGPACGSRKAVLKCSVLCLHCTGMSCKNILDQIVLDDDNAEDAEKVSDQIQDDEDQTDNAELAEYGAELMSDDDNNERDSVQCHKRHKVK
ncbi:hypothetical protein JTB14_035724 [Gonioctena quinquepunctata]|nr:hypothetical protein JTB14_035724 [Gonioctena quinquepunctata]